MRADPRNERQGLDFAPDAVRGTDRSDLAVGEATGYCRGMPSPDVSVLVPPPITLPPVRPRADRMTMATKGAPMIQQAIDPAMNEPFRLT